MHGALTTHTHTNLLDLVQMKSGLFAQLVSFILAGLKAVSRTLVEWAQDHLEKVGSQLLKLMCLLLRPLCRFMSIK